MNYRRLILNIASGFGLRAVNLLSNLIIVPFALRGLGSDDYGLLSTLLSATVFFAYADLGMGLTIVNRVAGGIDDDCRRAISRAWATLILLGALLVIFGSAIVVALHRATAPPGHLAAWLVAVASIGLALPTGLSQRILFGLQRNFEAGAWNAGGRVVAVGGVVLCERLHAPVYAYTFAIVGAPMVVGWLNTAYMFVGRDRHLRPVLRQIDFAESRRDVLQGLQFTLLQIAVFVESGVDNIIISAMQGNAHVAHYDLQARMFNYIPALVSIAAFPLWPALREGIATGDRSRAIRLSTMAEWTCLAVSALVALFGVALHHRVISAWTGVPYSPDWPLAVGLGIASVCSAFSMVQSTCLNAFGAVAIQSRAQLICMPVLLAAKVLAIVLIGPTAIPYVMVAIIVVRVTYLKHAARQLVNQP